MKPAIACLGWGSLIWDPCKLPIQRSWCEDGPLVWVEFVRQSDDGRLTLVLYKNPDEPVEPVPSLWARMTVNTRDEAVRALTQRECPGITEARIGSWSKKNIGKWSRDKADPPNIPGLGDWATRKDIDYVIWTNLEPSFPGKEKGRGPNKKEAVEYLRKLSEEGKATEARRYVQCAPPQIDTAYRRCIEAEFGWSPHCPQAPPTR